MDDVVHPGESASIATSVLVRLREQDQGAWEKLVGLYGPVVYRWCRRAGLRAEDAADVGQEVFAAMARSVASFRRDRQSGSFRGWLWTITRNKLHDHWRSQAGEPKPAGGTTAQQRLQEAPEPLTDYSAEAQPDDWLTIPGAILNEIRDHFKEQTWQAFWRVTVEDQAPSDVAEALAISVGAVYIAKSRVLHQLRQALGDLLDE
jgi:RNA polymerase sigma-70 factor (ECF subfamily)